ncbi:MAG: type II toxin-antitoxin system ParD family antitoxin, partial [Terracidiphilus sp.]
MPTRNVSLTKELDQFVASKVEGGKYANASEVMRTALRLLEREEREYEEKMAILRVCYETPGSFLKERSLRGAFFVFGGWIGSGWVELAGELHRP